VTPPFSFRYRPVLGTELHVVVGCETAELAERTQRRVLEEILRLEALLSTYRVDSPLSRWMRADAEADDEGLPDEVVTVLALAEDWFIASSGALHPGLGRLRARWRRAERDGRPPTPGECRRLAEKAQRLPFVIGSSGGVRRVHRNGDCSSLDLDALAKGWIVDRAAEAAIDPAIGWVLVNVGGDLRLTGSGLVRVAIEDPASTIDNAPPLGVVAMTPGGLASSGPARRGFQVGNHWYGHVLDPRTGWPVESTTGVTVIAGDTVTADALATVIGVEGLDHPRVTALLAEHDAAALAVTALGAGAGDVQLSHRWREDVDFELLANG
jgi:FAD:protein FMN transferase